jgi:hypothetical protein
MKRKPPPEILPFVGTRRPTEATNHDARPRHDAVQDSKPHPCAQAPASFTRRALESLGLDRGVSANNVEIGRRLLQRRVSMLDGETCGHVLAWVFGSLAAGLRVRFSKSLVYGLGVFTKILQWRGGCINMLRESGDWVVCFSAINIFCSAFSSNCIFQI